MTFARVSTEPEFRTLGAPIPATTIDQLAVTITEQRGLVTREQCLEAGMTSKAVRWKLESGQWLRAHPGVYQTLRGKDDWRTTALGAQLAVPGSAWSHHTAAHVHGLLSHPPDRVDLLVDSSKRVTAPRGVTIHRRLDADSHLDPLHWPWRTTIEETVLDVTTTASVDEVFAILGRAFQRQLTTEDALRGHLAARTRHPHRKWLEVVLADAASGAESALEMRFLRDVERAHGLPVGVRQRSTEPSRAERHDVAYEEQRVLVELDGRLGHDGTEARIRDGVRDRRSATTGWLTTRAFWRDVLGFPCDLAYDLGAVFYSRGWVGTLKPCRRRQCCLRQKAR
jgi:hypothetical protein